ncbi:hypothetical protein CH274_28180 [Rhodococcus sp. 06-418-5]|uniref:phosphotransferase n=1 Tax=Rhodococcus sp. 06-418-5 TaxID=2022507 RepID=UPI000B9B99C4|nr:phosphotransferase [Rhodococcus sp. 06-418-5]OZC73389.1 hypothetical protein CH274_28180 [Rhodococcus sp. 06-418-5]
MNDETEIPLPGGNRTVVHRVGETVRRATGDHSAAVHFLLNQLERRGFPYAPRFAGIDDRGREILTYRHGTAGNYPMPATFRTVEALESATRIVRRLHDVTVGLRLPDGHARHLRDGVDPEVICHWDAAPYNFVFEGREAVGLIDFDEAGPGRGDASTIWHISPIVSRLSAVKRTSPTEGGRRAPIDTTGCAESSRFIPILGVPNFLTSSSPDSRP